MKKLKEIEQLADKIYFKVDGFEKEISESKRHFIHGYTKYQEDMLKEIQSLIDGYKSDILLLKKEFIDSSSVLTLEKIVTLQGVITNLEKII